jgi:hypothetical protein
MSEKAVCVISANCQGAYIKALLERHAGFAPDFDVHYFVNYQKESVPAELLARCDLLIYQPLGANWGELSNDALRAAVPASCRRLSINYLTFTPYWPSFAGDPRNEPTERYPFGPFPYGDKWVIDRVQAGEPAARIAAAWASREYADSIDFDAVIDDYVETQRQIEQRRDQKLLDWIMDNFRATKLFETYNHPSQPLCIRQVDDLLQMLGYRALEGAEQLPLEYLKVNQQPIHPQVARALDLGFEAAPDTLYRIWGKPMPFARYAAAYAGWNVADIGSDLDGNANDNPQELFEKPAPQRAPGFAKRLASVQPAAEGRPQIIFVHIPKTAGTSLNEMLDEALGGDAAPHYNATMLLMKDTERRNRALIRGHIHYDICATLNPHQRVFTFLRDPVDRTISAFEFMKAHPETWLGKLAQGSIAEFLDHTYVAQSIADLQTRMLGSTIDSRRLYAQLVQGKLTREQYLEKFQQFALAPPDEECLARAKERLGAMLHVGFTESFTEDCERLFAKLELPCPAVRQSNRTPSAYRKRDSYKEEEIELIRRMNRFDTELYTYARELRAGGQI